MQYARVKYLREVQKSGKIYESSIEFTNYH